MGTVSADDPWGDGGEGDYSAEKDGEMEFGLSVVGCGPRRGSKRKGEKDGLGADEGG